MPPCARFARPVQAQVHNRLYVDTTNVRAQSVYAALGMNGDHYRVFEDMF
jgi:hypothetical protein